MNDNSQSEFDFFQSCVIPFRLIDNRIEFLMITSIKKKKWIFPKGYLEFNLTAFESAKKEAYEEAGVIGENDTAELGSFISVKKNGKSFVKVFSMEVSEELKDFPEKNLRKRKWMTLSEVMEKNDNKEIQKLVTKLAEQFSKNHQNPA